MILRFLLFGVACLCGAGLVVGVFGVSPAEGHRRSSLVFPASPPAVGEKSGGKKGPLASGEGQPDQLWGQFLVLEKSGDLLGAYRIAWKLVNLFPEAPQRGPVLLRLANLLEREGKLAEAVEVYGLAAVLSAGSPTAAEARVAARALLFLKTLPQEDPFTALERLVGEVSGPSACASPPPVLKQALAAGWQAALAKLEAETDPPLAHLDNILRLWELQPPGLRAPGTASRLAELLRRHGLWETARTLVQSGGESGESDPVRPHLSDPQVSSFSWGLSGLFGSRSLAPWACVPGLDRFSPAFSHVGPCFPRRAFPFSHPVPGPISLRPQGGGWRSPWGSLGPPSVPGALRIPTGHGSPGGTEPDPPAVPAAELEPFQRERQAMAHLRQGQTEEAEAAFFELSRSGDPFWQRLGRVRLAEVALTRMAAGSSP